MKKHFLPIALLTPMAALAQDKPNIIFILCDDMGYGDLGCYGQRYIATPNLDNMAQEGMRFTQAYAGSPVSAPSRATIMTGQHTGHTWVRGNKEYRSNYGAKSQYNGNYDYDTVGQEPYTTDHIILPEVMKQAGYTTGMFGKWAGGYEGSHSTPATRGVDEYYGYICQFEAHTYYPNFLNRYSPRRGDTDVRRVTMEENIKYGGVMTSGSTYRQRPQYSADMIHREAMEWLEYVTTEKSGTPFYGFFTYTLPHAELLQPHDSIYTAYNYQFCDDSSYSGAFSSWYHSNDATHTEFAAMITRLDSYVGEILALLKEKGLDDNTIVIFSSDNGPHEEGGADPSFFNRDGKLQGLKRSCHEGGIRIPFIARWPGHIEAGQESDLMFAFYDMMPTFMDIAGVGDQYPDGIKKSDTDIFDGISIAPTLLGQPQTDKHEHLYWEFHETKQLGVRKGDWKLVMKNNTYYLYNLATDLHEDNDVKAQYPEVLAELKAIAQKEHTTPQVDYFNFSIPN